MLKGSNMGKRKSGGNSNSPYAMGTGRPTADVVETNDQAENEIQQMVQEVQQLEWQPL